MTVGCRIACEQNEMSRGVQVAFSPYPGHEPLLALADQREQADRHIELGRRILDNMAVALIAPAILAQQFVERGKAQMFIGRNWGWLHGNIRNVCTSTVAFRTAHGNGHPPHGAGRCLCGCSGLSVASSSQNEKIANPHVSSRIYRAARPWREVPVQASSAHAA
jgi:hypothetical protein